MVKIIHIEAIQDIEFYSRYMLSKRKCCCRKDAHGANAVNMLSMAMKRHFLCLLQKYLIVVSNNKNIGIYK